MNDLACVLSIVQLHRRFHPKLKEIEHDSLVNELFFLNSDSSTVTKVQSPKWHSSFPDLNRGDENKAREPTFPWQKQPLVQQDALTSIKFQY